MAILAVILQDRQNIFIEGGRRRTFGTGGEVRQLPSSRRRQERERGEDNARIPHDCRNSNVSAHACRAACGSYAARSSQKKA